LRIDPETIERIKQAADITEVIGDYVSLKKKGANLWACCPFHGEKSPSFSVSPPKGIYKCFGCGKAGDSVRFVMDIEGLGYGEALRHLAKKYGIEIQETKVTDEQLEAQNARESLYIVLNYAKNYFHNLLFNHEEGQSIGYPYFKERGFNDLTIKAFELGYSLNIWDAFTKDAQKNGYSLEILEKAGLTIVKEGQGTAQAPPAPERGASDDKIFDDKAPPSGTGGTSSRLYDRFRNRVIFPIHNVSGKVIAFGARILTKDKNQPKYLNSPETEVYHKSNILYGIFQAKNEIRTKDVCYLVEGYTDVVSLYQAGIKNVVASSGTSLTIEQIRLINRFTPNITVLYDGDPAGIKASLRGMDMILEEGLNVKLVVFPDGEDPDSYVQKIGTEAFSTYIKDTATDFITFKAELSLKEAGNDPFKKAEIIKDMVGSISKIPDSIKRSVFFQKTASLMNIDESILIAESNKISLERSKQKDKDFQRQSNQQRLQNNSPNTVPLNDRPAIPPSDMMSFSEDDEGGGQFTGDFGGGMVVEMPDLPPISKPPRSPLSYHEEECVRLLVNYGKREVDPNLAPGVTLAQYILSEIEGIEFKTPIFEQIITICRNKFLEGIVLEASYFIGHEDSEIQQESINLVSERHVISEQWKKKHEIIVPEEKDKLSEMAFTNILRLKKAYNGVRMDEIKRNLMLTSDPTEQNHWLTQYMEAKEIEKQIAKELGTVVVR
jgi:DNA primase